MYQQHILPRIQLTICWLFKSHLVRLMIRNGFLVNQNITARQLRRFFAGYHEHDGKRFYCN